MRFLATVFCLSLLAASLVACGGQSNNDNGAGKADAARAELGKALALAAYEEDSEEVKALLELGADANFRDERGGTALMQAAMTGGADIAAMLIEKGANVDAQTAGGNTALMVAAEKGHFEILELLLAAGADPLIKNNVGATAVVNAAFSAHSECVLLLKKAEVAAEDKAAQKDGPEDNAAEDEAQSKVEGETVDGAE